MTSTRLGYASLVMLWVGLGSGCTAVPPCPTPDPVPVPAAQTSLSMGPTNTALQQKVHAQEKRIRELSMQLKLLKRIDQDQQKQR